MTTDSTLIAGNQTDTAPGAQPDANAGKTAPADTSTSTEGDQGQAKPAADKSADDKTGDDKAGDDKGKSAEKPVGAPETYEAFKLPEGVTLDETVGTELQALAKELNLPQDQAQKIADLGAKQAQRFVTQQQELLAKTSDEWVATVKADKEFGGDKLDENIGIAKKALDTFGTPELRTLLKDTKLGNHPEIIRAFYRVGKQISEDNFVAGRERHGSTTAPLEERAAAKLYKN